MHPCIGVFFFLPAVLLCVSGMVHGDGPNLLVEPPDAVLAGRLERLQILVTSGDAEDEQLDRTHEADYLSLAPGIARVDATGRVVPLAEGTAPIRVHWGGTTVTVPTRVVLSGESASASFLDHVEPILSKAGCNLGSCHASQFGKGGLRLSVFGNDPESDYLAIARDSSQRRVSTLQAEDSLILRKAALQIGHGGGRRFLRNSYAWEVLHTWIGEGAARARVTEPEIAGLTVSPGRRRYRVDQRQQLRVAAHYRDGSVRDVTERSQYDSLNDGVATVVPDGRLTVTGRGLTAIMVRYRGQVAVAQIMSPYASETQLVDFAPANFIDTHIVRLWQEMGLRPSADCTDAEFIRRAFLDCLGTLPAAERVESFLDSRDPRKRAALVDEILGLTGDPSRNPFAGEFSAFWTLKFGDLLRNNRKATGDTGMWALHNWLRQAFRTNLPLDQLARALITAQGSIYEYGPANYVAFAPTAADEVGVASPTDLAETTAQVFLGVRLQCARCHNHPFEVYSQRDYYGLAAFFTGLESKSSGAFGELGFDTVVSLKPAAPLRLPSTGEIVTPRPLGKDPIVIVNLEIANAAVANAATAADTGDANTGDATVADLRESLADWLLDPGSGLFARSFVNRVWADVMGVGLVDPVDDLRSTNPPSNPELLDALAATLIEQKYDLRQLLRVILNSRVYQLSASPRPENLEQVRFCTHYNARRLSAEVLLDAIDFASGTHEKFPGVPLGTRAIDLPDSNFESYFLDTLGRPQRLTFCACERTAQPNLAQVLHLANGDLLQRKLNDPSGRIDSLLQRGVTDAVAVRELYLVTFSRPPTSEELHDCLGIIQRAENRRAGLATVLWALCNSREFLLNH